MQSLRASSCTLPGQHLGHLPRAKLRSSRPARKTTIKAEGACKNKGVTERLAPFSHGRSSRVVRLQAVMATPRPPQRP